MNTKDEKKKEPPSKPKSANRGKKKQDGWFVRNRTLFALSIETLVVIILILLAFWYFSYKVTHLNDSFVNSNTEIKRLEQKLDSLLVAQNQLLAKTLELHNAIAEQSLNSAVTDDAPEKGKPVSRSNPKNVTDASEKESSLFFAWETWLVIILIIFASVLAYYALHRNTKKDFDDAF